MATPPRVRTLMDVTSLQLKAPPVPGGKRPAALSIQSWRNKPSITVWSNLDGAPNVRRFGLNLYPYVFSTILESLKQVALLPFVEGERIARKVVIYDKPSKDKQRVGDITYGRDESGVMYICVISPDEAFPKIPFMFIMSRQVEFQGLTKQEASRDYCLGCIAFWEQLMPTNLWHSFVDETQQPQQQSNQPNSGYTSYLTQAATAPPPTDDDIPW